MPKITTKLWSHQQQMTDFALKELNELGYTWWIAGCATGKTLTTYNLANELGAKRTLVLTKKTIIDQAWGGTAERFTSGFNYIPLNKGTSKDKAELMWQRRNSPNSVFVVNYETAALIAPELTRMKFDLVVADESHKLKTHNSQQSMKLALALNDVPMHVAMTGTAWDDRPTDSYGQVRWMSGAYKRGKTVGSKVLGAWTNFFEEYVVYRQIDNIKIPIRYKNQDQLRRKIDPFTMYLNSEDVLDLPPEIDINRYVEWTPELKRIYRDLEVEMIAQSNGGTVVADNVLTQGLRLHQLTGGYFAADTGGHFVATPKIDAVVDILDEIGGQPTVIFTAFTTDVEALKPALEKEWYKVKLLIGGTYEHEEFQRGDGDVILVNLSAGNAGIELTRARYAIYYSVGNSRTDYRQSRYRVRRPGSNVLHPITYFHLVLPGSVDEDLHKAMSSKGKLADYLLEGLQNRVQ